MLQESMQQFITSAKVVVVAFIESSTVTRSFIRALAIVTLVIVHLELPFVDSPSADETDAHTVVTHQFSGMSRSRNALQVVGRCDHCDLERSAEGDGHHIPLKALAHSDTSI